MEQTDSDQRGGGRRIAGERRGRGKPRNMKRGSWAWTMRGRIDCGSGGDGAGESNGENVGQL